MNGSNSGPVDNLYQVPLEKVADFEFDAKVTAVFDDMVKRSVPGYDVVVDMIGVIGGVLERLLGQPLVIYDLGCSRGAVTQALLKNLKHESNSITSIDSSADMIQAASKIITDTRVSFEINDISQMKLEKADMVVLNLVLQFLPTEQRLSMVTKIHRALNPGGLLILTEKVRTTDDDIVIHEQFKSHQGYSALEIQQKREALEQVMQIDTPTAHEQRLSTAGFSKVQVWFKLLNWISYMAWK